MKHSLAHILLLLSIALGIALAGVPVYAQDGTNGNDKAADGDAQEDNSDDEDDDYDDEDDDYDDDDDDYDDDEDDDYDDDENDDDDDEDEDYDDDDDDAEEESLYDKLYDEERDELRADWLDHFTLDDKDVFDDWLTMHLRNALSGGHYIKTRPKIEAFLRKYPNSFEANYLMALLFWNGEGNLLRALQHFKKGMQIFEDKYCNNPEGIPSGDGNYNLRTWHRRLYSDLADLYEELDMRQPEYDTRVRKAKLYHEELDQDAVWGMIKLGMFEEAAAISLKTIAEGGWASGSAYNDLMVIEESRHRQMSCYRRSVESVNYRGNRGSCAVPKNHAEILSELMRMEESLAYYKKAAEHLSICINNPYSDMSRLYYADVQWQQSISAMTRVLDRKVNKRKAVQTAMDERADLSMLLYTMGFSEKAAEFMVTVVNAPGRLGHNSLHQEQMDMAHRTVYFAILRDVAARAKEQLDAYTGLAPLWWLDADVRQRVRKLQDEYVKIQGKLWSTNQRLFKDALHAENRKSFLVPYFILPPNFYPSLVDALGQRAMEQFVEEQVNSLEPEAYEAMRSNFSYIRAYIAWRDGDRTALRTRIDDYRRERVPHIRMLDLEIDLMEADLLLQQGDKDGAYDLFSQVYVLHPTLFRSRNVPLPVRFDDSMSGEFADIRRVLEHSPRFDVRNDAPFVISAKKISVPLLAFPQFEGTEEAQIYGSNAQQVEIPQICIASAMGQRFACSSTDIWAYPHFVDGVPHTAEVIHNFLHVAFTPRIDATQDGIALGGSATTRSADEAVKELLKHTRSNRKKTDISDIL